MAHFYGNLGSVTRCGHKNSGLSCHIRGWNSGIEVYAKYNPDKDLDEFDVYVTSGSSCQNKRKFIGTFTLKDLDNIDSHDEKEANHG